MDMQSLKQKQHELTEKRDELRKRLDAIQKEIAKGLDQDWEEQAIQLENAEVLDEIARVTSEELSKLEHGIERIEKALTNEGIRGS